MGKLEKLVVISTLIFWVAATLNIVGAIDFWLVALSASGAESVSYFWWFGIFLSFASLLICINDCEKRNIEKADRWIGYMVISSGVGMVHYFFKYGRHPRH